MLLDDDMLATFDALLAEARASADPEPTAMTLATVGADGRISARQVLLKAHDARGFVFYTHATSRKGEQLASVSRAALNFFWRHLTTPSQVRIEGVVEFVADADADAYFASRPRESKLGAWASDQSKTLDARSTFEERFGEAERRFHERDIPRPSVWRGYRVRPDLIEFWYSKPFRLHQRDCHEWQGGHWQHRQLYP